MKRRYTSYQIEGSVCIYNKRSSPVHASMKSCSQAGGKDAIYLWVVMLGFSFKSLSWLIIY